jgi:cell division transport system ATP-binding protein
MLKLDKISLAFPDGTQVFKDLSFKFPAKSITLLTGPSGSGKTSILRLIMRELKPTAGKIFYQDKDITKLKSRQIPFLRRSIGAAFQDYKLLEDRTVAENLSLISQILHKSKRPDISALLKTVGLENKKHHFPRQLSGGEQQRVAIARALITDPDLIFADEPTGNLDENTADKIIELFDKINQAGKTVIIATHNKNLLSRLKKALHLDLKP